MRDYEHRRGPIERAVGVAVEVYDVRLMTLRQIQQPLTCTRDVIPRVLHPFEFVGALVNADVLQSVHLGSLILVDRRPHRREDDLDAVRLERARQLDRVRPHPPDRIRRHQHAHGTSCSLTTYIITKALKNPSGRSRVIRIASLSSSSGNRCVYSDDGSSFPDATTSTASRMPSR